MVLAVLLVADINAFYSSYRRCRYSLWFFLENEKCSGVYNIVTPKIFSLSEICSALSNSLSMQHQIALPEPLLNLFLGDVASHFLVNRKVLPTRLLSHGFMFTFTNVN